jgi:hypothetical protein
MVNVVICLPCGEKRTQVSGVAAVDLLNPLLQKNSSISGQSIVHCNKNMTIFHEKSRDIFIATCCFRVVVHDNAV